jgi:2-polyprenyl-6-methoxyphenol hydroxylase-like FAD-dependent oxidoreductase
MGGVIFPIEPSAASDGLVPDVRLVPREDYVACIVAARPEYIGRSDSDLRKASSGDLQRLACDLLSDWPDVSRRIPAAGEQGSFFYVEMYTSVPFELDASPNVTLLGDAIHAMSPSLGRGANLALHDAAQLGRRIVAVQQGEAILASALRDYEIGMTEYGFGVVRRAAEKGAYILGQEPLPDSSESVRAHA